MCINIDQPQRRQANKKTKTHLRICDVKLSAREMTSTTIQEPPGFTQDTQETISQK